MQQPQQKNMKMELHFKRLVTDSGLSQGAAEELWKWYDSSGKNGVASY